MIIPDRSLTVINHKKWKKIKPDEADFTDNGHGAPGANGNAGIAFRNLRPQGRDPEQIIRDHAQDIQAISTVLTPVRAPLIEALPNLEIIACGAVGYDHVDMDVALARGGLVTNTPGVLTDDTADTAILLMLNVMRKAVEGDAYVVRGCGKRKATLVLV